MIDPTKAQDCLVFKLVRVEITLPWKRLEWRRDEGMEPGKISGRLVVTIQAFDKTKGIRDKNKQSRYADHTKTVDFRSS